jgi:hypothetical protein
METIDPRLHLSRVGAVPAREEFSSRTNSRGCRGVASEPVVAFWAGVDSSRSAPGSFPSEPAARERTTPPRPPRMSPARDDPVASHRPR